MAKIINTSAELKREIHETNSLKNFKEFEEILDYLYALKIKPQKATIWKYFDKWVLSINYKEK